ncbi:Oidioi.mRNA.OKI2018_I69.chr2.g4669.t1.cds [Oikopleura dioica]|uniref:Oidioi.mRNA.OKI2018_I69.chr2.g4669.t1.cds n=1 Tax=Oikopleura dioica TaxID=34765 RepID=A0ABN7T1F6_OIKDI|nr:Oidioi.mRNA.OKI2018_I69.chr2.g4669.t1.cds [Oikopleura dioica]
MKFVRAILVASAQSRLMINMDKSNDRNGPLQVQNSESDSNFAPDRFLGQNAQQGDSCCSNIIVHDLLNGQRTFQRAVDQDAWLDNRGDVIFFNSQFQIWQLLPQSKANFFGTAFSSGSFDEGKGCPTDNTWTVSNKNRWTTVPNYLTCQSSISSEDALAYDLSERVCEMMKNMVPRLKEYKMDALCQRAKFIADRVIRQRSCASSSLTRADSNLVMSLDTLREWRDKLMAINARRNENCDNNDELDGAIQRFYSSMKRKVMKNNRK